MAKEETTIESEAFKFLGIEAENLDQFKEKFNESYIPSDKLGSELGAFKGQTTTAIKQAFRDFDIEVTSDELKDKKLTEIPSLYAEKLKAKFTELESSKKLTNEQLEEKYGNDIQKYKTQLTEKEELLNGLRTEFETFKTNVATEKKQLTIDTKKNAIIGSLPFSENTDKYQKNGWLSEINSSYQFDIDDEGNERVLKDGKPIQSAQKAGTFATYEEVIKGEFEKTPFKAVANPKQVRKFVTEPSGKTVGVNGRKLASRH